MRGMPLASRYTRRATATSRATRTVGRGTRRRSGVTTKDVRRDSMSHCLPWCHRAVGILRPRARPWPAPWPRLSWSAFMRRVPAAIVGCLRCRAQRARQARCREGVPVDPHPLRQAAQGRGGRPSVAVPAAPVKRAAKVPDSPHHRDRCSRRRSVDGAAREANPRRRQSPPRRRRLPPAPSLAATAKARSDGAARTGRRRPSRDEVLIAIRKTEPEFPGNLMRTLRKGMVQVSFTVQPDGSVTQPRVVSTTHPRLAQTAVATVSQWRFQPVSNAQEAVRGPGLQPRLRPLRPSRRDAAR